MSRHGELLEDESRELIAFASGSTVAASSRTARHSVGELHAEYGGIAGINGQSVDGILLCAVFPSWPGINVKPCLFRRF